MLNVTRTYRWQRMKNFWLKAASMTAMGGTALFPFALSGRAFAQAADTSVKSKQESPLACNAFALSPEQRNRHFDELGPALRSLKRSVRELDDGYEFEFPADAAALQLLAEWTIQERADVLFLTSTCDWIEKEVPSGCV